MRAHLRRPTAARRWRPRSARKAPLEIEYKTAKSKAFARVSRAQRGRNAVGWRRAISCNRPGFALGADSTFGAFAVRSNGVSEWSTHPMSRRLDFRLRKAIAAPIAAPSACDVAIPAASDEIRHRCRMRIAVQRRTAAASALPPDSMGMCFVFDTQRYKFSAPNQDIRSFRT
jgi:hypothetical protein